MILCNSPVSKWVFRSGTQLTGALLLGVFSTSLAQANKEAIEYPATPLFGDTHLHSSWSTDAGMGGASLGPEVALLCHWACVFYTLGARFW